MKYRLRIMQFLIGLSILGLVLATYSLLHKTGLVPGSFCDINTKFNCDVVNRGAYSDIGVIPVALLGVIGYVFFLAASILKLREPHDRHTSLFLLLATGCGFLFSLYLSSIEEFVLHTWCIVCLSSQFTVAALFILSCWLFLGERSASRKEQVSEIVKSAAQDISEL